jgi:fatty-acyl-CoA synthase
LDNLTVVYEFADLEVRTTPQVLAAVAEHCPDRLFVVAEDGSATYATAARTAVALAGQLRAAGVRPGDRVGVALPNGVRWCLALLAAHALGASALPLNTWQRPAETAGVLRRAQPRVVVTDTEIAARIGLTTDLLFWERGDEVTEATEATSLDAAISTLRTAPTREDDDALVLFTSGSTAEPKAVRLGQAGMVRTGHAIGERQGVRADDRIWFALPLFFVFGCSNALPNTLTHAATLCLQERFEPAAALEFLERHRCTVYYGVASITRALVACPDLPRRDISGLRTGTANATAEDLRLAIEVLGVREVCNAYGMTEGHGHTTITAHTDPPEVRMACQGTPLPTQQVCVVDHAGVPVPVGTVGHIRIRGVITPGYLDNAELNDTAFDADGWFRTGDLGTLDEHGRLRFVGRSGEMIKAKGINVSPSEVEAVLGTHPDVAEAFVFAVDLATGDQVVGCVLIAQQPAVDPEKLIDVVVEWSRDRLSSYKVPTRMWVRGREALPLTATGKVSKRLLRDQVSAEPLAD